MNKDQQSNQINQQLLRLQACPMSASVNWDPAADTQADIIKWYSYYNKLPLNTRVGLADEAVIERILAVAQNFKILDEKKVGEISRMVRENFFKPASKGDVTKRSQDKLGISSEDENLFYDAFRDIINTVEVQGNEQVKQSTEEMPIIPALKKYPGLKEQKISEEKIKNSEIKEFVRGTLGNWIDDYIQRKGAQSHDNIERSDFVFNSENARKLSDKERRVLSVILDSYDNDTNLNIHTENQEIIFLQGESFSVKEVPEKKEDIKQEPEVGRNYPKKKDKKKGFFSRFKKKNREIKKDNVEEKKEEKKTIPPKIEEIKIKPFSGQKKDNKKSLEEKKEPEEKTAKISSDKKEETKSPFEQWRMKNLGISKEEVHTKKEKPKVEKKEKIPNLNSVVEVKKEALPKKETVEPEIKKEEVAVRLEGNVKEDGTQEIGWFGESTGEDENVGLQIKKPTEETQKEDKKGADKYKKKLVTRNYRELPNKKSNRNKNVIDLKEVI